MEEKSLDKLFLQRYTLKKKFIKGGGLNDKQNEYLFNLRLRRSVASARCLITLRIFLNERIAF